MNKPDALPGPAIAAGLAAHRRRRAAVPGRWAARLAAGLLLACGMATAAPPPGEAAASPASAPALTETVTIAGEDDWAPYSSVAAGSSQPVGLAVDIVREAFATQGIAVRFVGLPFARCMYLAKVGRVAGCFNATLVDDLRDDYHWHATPMFHEELAIFGRTADGHANVTLADLEGRSVGYTLGYTYPLSFRQNERIRKVEAKSDQQLLQMLRSGRVDFILINTLPAWLRMAGDPALRDALMRVGVVSQDGFWVAFTKATPDGQRLSQRFEQGLAVLQASGRLAQMQSALRRRLGH